PNGPSAQHKSTRGAGKGFTQFGLRPRKSETKSNPKRLCTVMSTVSSSKHGHQEKGTELPREKLVRTLKTCSKLSSTGTRGIERSGYRIRAMRIRNGVCPKRSWQIPGV